jgi:hypothetical protein
MLELIAGGSLAGVVRLLHPTKISTKLLNQVVFKRREKARRPSGICSV